MARDVRLNVRVDGEVFDRMRSQALREGRTVSEIVRQLMIDYLIARANGSSLAIIPDRISAEKGSEV